MDWDLAGGVGRSLRAAPIDYEDGGRGIGS